MIVITAATKQEIDRISRCLDSRQRIANDGYVAWQGTCKNKEILAVQTGIGKGMVEGVLGPLLTCYKATALLSLGFGGALTGELSTGNLVICSTVIPLNETDGCLSTEVNPCYANEHLVTHAIEAAGGSGLKWTHGKSVTVSRLVSNMMEKQELGERTRAQVCEMEDYWISRIAASRQIPFLAVRIIYDEISTRLPDFKRMIDIHGNDKPWWATAYILRHPRQFVNVLSSYRNCSRAKDGLSVFVVKLLDVL